MAAAPQLRQFQDELTDNLAQQVGVTTTNSQSPSLVHIDAAWGAFAKLVEAKAAQAYTVAAMQAMQMRQIDEDFCGWLVDQASALRARRTYSLDWDNLAEELEAMAAQDRRTMRRQLQRLLAHLLKYLVQPNAVEHHESWRRTIRDARNEIQDLLKESPGIFQGKRDEAFAEAFKRAREDASDETKLPLRRIPEINPWTFDQVLTDQDITPRRYAEIADDQL